MKHEQEQISASKKAGINWIARAAGTVIEPLSTFKVFNRQTSFRFDKNEGLIFTNNLSSPNGYRLPLEVRENRWPYLLQKLGYNAFSIGYGRRDWTAESLDETTDALATAIATQPVDDSIFSTPLMKQPPLRQLSKSIHVRPLLGSKKELIGSNLWTRQSRHLDWGDAPEPLTEIANRLGFRDFDHVLDTSSLPYDAGLYIAQRYQCSVTSTQKPSIFQRAIRRKLREADLTQKVVVSKNTLSDMKASFTKILGLFPYELHSHSKSKSFIDEITARATSQSKLGLSVLCLGSQQEGHKEDIYDMTNISDLRFPTITGLAANLEKLGWNVSRIEELSNFDAMISPLSPSARSQPRHITRRRNDFTAAALKSLVKKGLITSYMVIASR